MPLVHKTILLLASVPLNLPLNQALHLVLNNNQPMLLVPLYNKTQDLVVIHQLDLEVQADLEHLAMLQVVLEMLKTMLLLQAPLEAIYKIQLDLEGLEAIARHLSQVQQQLDLVLQHLNLQLALHCLVLAVPLNLFPIVIHSIALVILLNLLLIPIHYLEALLNLQPVVLQHLEDLEHLNLLLVIPQHLVVLVVLLNPLRAPPHLVASVILRNRQPVVLQHLEDLEHLNLLLVMPQHLVVLVILLNPLRAPPHLEDLEPPSQLPILHPLVLLLQPATKQQMQFRVVY